MIRMLAFTAALVAAPVAAAQEAVEAPPATAEQIASARAIADRMIADAGASGIFVNKTDDAVPTVLHVASGMTCSFSGGPRDRLYIFPSPTGRIARGEDVGCISWDETLGIDLTLYATRYQPLPSERAVLEDAVRAIRQRWPDAAPFEGDLVSMSSEGQPAPLQAAFKIQIDGQPMLTVALVSHRDGWGYKARATGPADSMIVSLFAQLSLSAALLPE